MGLFLLVKDNIQNALGFIWVLGDAFWFYQCPFIIHEYDEQCTLQLPWWFCPCVLGQHPCIFMHSEDTCWTPGESPRSSSLTLLVCKGVEMQHHGQRGRVPWTLDYATRGCSFKTKDEGRRGVGSSPRSEGGQIILGVCQLLSPLCTRICGVGIPLTYLTKKDIPWMWGPPQWQAFQKLKRSFM